MYSSNYKSLIQQQKNLSAELIGSHHIWILTKLKLHLTRRKNTLGYYKNNLKKN